MKRVGALRDGLQKKCIKGWIAKKCKIKRVGALMVQVDCGLGKSVQNEEGWVLRADCKKKYKIKTVGALRGTLQKKCKIKRFGALRDRLRVDYEKKCKLKRVGYYGADCKKSAKLRGLGH